MMKNKAQEDIRDQTPPDDDTVELSDEAAAADEPAEAVDEVTALRQEVGRLSDERLRLAAELQNQQKRAQRERQEALRYAEADFARELLVIIDDLERTLASAEETPAAGPVTDGVRIVYDHFMKILGQRGIRRIEAAGHPFDPTYHEAMMQQPSDEHPAGTVVQELQCGYTMHDRVLRCSRVIVSTGPAAPAEG